MIKELQEIRAFLETLWVNRSPEDQCDFVCRFLLRLYPSAKLQGGFNYRGGKEILGGGGYLDRNEHWQLHYWLVHEGHILGLASDQFSGGKPVVYLPFSNSEAKCYRSTDTRVALQQITDHPEVVTPQWLLNWQVWQGKPVPKGSFILMQYGQPWQVFPAGTTLDRVRQHLTRPELTWSYLVESPIASRI